MLWNAPHPASWLRIIYFRDINARVTLDPAPSCLTRTHHFPSRSPLLFLTTYLAFASRVASRFFR